MAASSPPLPTSAESLSNFLATLGVTRVDSTLLVAAFTHPSYRTLDPHAESYERLEFLGDAVLNLVVGAILFRAAPDAPEGLLTERRAAFVNRDALARIYDHLGLGKFLRTAPGYVPSLKDKGNVVEALFGAVFIGRDFATCHTLWHSLVAMISSPQEAGTIRQPRAGTSPKQLAYQQTYESLGIASVAVHNAKNSLQELCQKQGLPPPLYEEVSRTGPDHRPLFQVHLKLHPFAHDRGAVFETMGEGLTRKSAEIQAAERFCDQIFLPYLPQP